MPSAWAFKLVLDVVNTVTAILHHKPKNSSKSQCQPTQAPLRSIPSPSLILTSSFCRNPLTLCLPSTPSPNPPISDLDFALTKEWTELSINQPSTAPQNTYHDLFLPHDASRPGTLDILWLWSPHSSVLISEDESSYFHTWLCSHQKPTWGHPSGVTKKLITSTTYILNMSAHTHSELLHV